MTTQRSALELGRLYHRFTSDGASGTRAQKRAIVLYFVAEQLAQTLGLSALLLSRSRLASLAFSATAARSVPSWDRLLGTELSQAALRYANDVEADERGAAIAAAHHLGHTLDLLLASEVSDERRRLGSYYTPVPVARRLMERAAQALLLEGRTVATVCDPACGGGAFLIEAADVLARHPQLCAPPTRHGSAGRMRSDAAQVLDGLYGVDLSPLAIGVAEVALWIYSAQPSQRIERPGRLVVGDTLLDADHVLSPERVPVVARSDAEPTPHSLTAGESGDEASLSFRERFHPLFRSGRGFDWIVGNPPWVAFQGRATQKLAPERRAYYRARYAAFSGYPTLHALFVQRAAELAPRGAITLLLPSSLSDLDGYRAARARVRSTHDPVEPLQEFGQDAFAGVVQPCFGLVAFSRKKSAAQLEPSSDLGAPFRLAERRKTATELTASAPEFLAAFSQWPTLPKSTFGEMGFQSNSRVVQDLFLRQDAPAQGFDLPLLEGRNVAEFVVRPPRLFMRVDRELLAETRCRLRSAEAYQGVDFVVRQTAAYTIAAGHNGLAFRNSLIAGFAQPGLSQELLVALLNSAFFRALHCSRQRDARQAAFPQVKVAHLRGLPAPPLESAQCVRELEQLARQAGERGGLDSASRARLDGLVFSLFSVNQEQSAQLYRYLEAVAPAAIRPGLSE